MKDELVSAPSAGRSRVRSHLDSTSVWLGQHQSRLTAQHDAICRLTVGSKIIHTRHKHVLKRVRGERTRSVKDLAPHCLHEESVVLCLSDTHTVYVFIQHTVAHCPRYQQSVQYTRKLCSHPPLPMIQCSNSTLFCNTVTQSHQLFIKEFCTSSVMG